MKIDGVIIVQATTDPKETEYMVRLARQSEFITRVIGWLNPEADPQAPHQEIETLRKIPKLCGIRAHPPKEFDHCWLTDPAVKAGYRLIAASGMAVDFLANCTQLTPVGDLLGDVPGMTAVINHGGQPFVTTGAHLRGTTVCAMPGTRCFDR